MLEYKCERGRTHFVAVDPKDTTKECGSCSVKTDKPLWVREYSGPACRFEADRDANAVARRSLAGSQKSKISGNGVEDLFSWYHKAVGAGHSDPTPVETALPTEFSVCKVRHGSRKPHHQNQRFWLAVRSGASDDTLKREPSGER